jgi:hypothetical protein
MHNSIGHRIKKKEISKNNLYNENYYCQYIMTSAKRNGDIISRTTSTSI